MSVARDFSLAKYGEVCRALVEAGYPALRFSEYLDATREARPISFVLLRHDVETSVAPAVRMAEVEAAHGLNATYFLRARVFDPRAIARLRALGHDIGYHYDTVARTRGDLSRATLLFARDLEELRRHGPVQVASMHGSPLFPWDNRDLWRAARPADFGLAGEVYRDVDYADVRYFSDTGRTWHPTRHNLRDHVAAPPECSVETTDELIALVKARRFARLCLLAHPDRWSESVFAWRARAARDAVENAIKDGLGRLYRRRSGTEHP
ncbi:MAG TPA: hypothetical protein VMR21_09850 [Vicinamibacteria bacterium]|nr:hypothetical protein [Vicinamibacteria bacterium]